MLYCDWRLGGFERLVHRVNAARHIVGHELQQEFSPGEAGGISTASRNGSPRFDSGMRPR